MNLLTETLGKIQPVDAEILAKAQAKLDNKTKPLGSLGRLEEFARRFAAITGTWNRTRRRRSSTPLPATMAWWKKGYPLSPRR